MLEQLSALPQVLGRVEHLLANTGFYSTKNVGACQTRGIDPFIAVKRDEHHPTPQERFTEPLALPTDATPARRIGNKLKTQVGRAHYALRKQTVEPVFGIIKSVQGFRQFSLRGLKKVTGESGVCRCAAVVTLFVRQYFKQIPNSTREKPAQLLHRL